MKVGVIQFVKGKWETGEKKILEAFSDQVTVHTMGEGFTWDTQDLKRDVAAADAAFAMASGRPLIARYAVSNGYKEVPSILEEVIAVNRDNLFETVVQDGFHREEDLR